MGFKVEDQKTRHDSKQSAELGYFHIKYNIFFVSLNRSSFMSYHKRINFVVDKKTVVIGSWFKAKAKQSPRKR